LEKFIINSRTKEKEGKNLCCKIEQDDFCFSLGN
jgi:hypothetical protein